jgi:hypothetical protein
MILQCFDKSNKRNIATAEMVKGLILSRSVSSTKCANFLSGCAQKSSKIKRIERYYARNYLNTDTAVRFLNKQFNSTQSIFCLDRTNWQHGSKDINALVLYGLNNTVSSMLNIKLLDNKGGNSNFDDRVEVLEPVIQEVKHNNIMALLGDREFFSFKFVHYLVTRDIPFVIRIKENLHFIQPIIKALKGTAKTWRNQLIGKFAGQEIRLDVAAKKLKDEYLLTVSYKVDNPLKTYRKRWAIECFFKAIKSSGFNVETTCLKHNDRLRALLYLCAMAYVICRKLGMFRHKYLAKMKFKKTLNCFQFSYFRYGLDWITELIYNAFNTLDCQDMPLDLIPSVR